MDEAVTAGRAALLSSPTSSRSVTQTVNESHRLLIGLDDDDDDDGVAEVDVRPTRPTRSRRPPAPPEGGWTLDHVMASLYDLTTDFRGYRQSTSKWRNQMDTRVARLDTRVSRLEGLIGEGAHTQEEEEEDDDNGDDTQSDEENGEDTASD
ncbi:uncharacterized protein LOC133302007 isoform X1 [Gastrolobium bilobum]|uniref:uncharacterized protein LOC133302007 isoform X1 n=1 Tax=Gastrolobium bilobum TaxID=150636 RepID=UPI002AB0899C|nr:uncharacterized protein LOC133302007 isoform X1 [Gastrolobium bilobum]